MLAERNHVVYHRERTIEGTADRLVLWCLVVNDLLADLQRRCFHVCDYADDVAIVDLGHLQPSGTCWIMP
jgi:hypothetical protein